MQQRKTRIFWLGMHEVLVRTELPRLRMLGYEVFNPPYLSSIRDQSANLDWDGRQESTLPADVFRMLSHYNFFYNKIAPKIADLLNTYFDAVIVTISPIWLTEFAKVYGGKLIFRVYGQIGVLSEHLYGAGLFQLLDKRDDFWFVPHASEALHGEHAWIKERMAIVPYCLPEDIFPHQDSWIGGSGETTIICPNLDNHFYRAHFKFLKRNFGERCYRYYGKQLRIVRDRNVVGTIDRSDLIERFRRSSAFVYTYRDPRVCYLPAIEMMVLGGPVLFLRGSLLDRYMPADAPGRCETVEVAKSAAHKLMAGDLSFANDIVASQSDLRLRYSPDYVWPLFDSAIRHVLSNANTAPKWLVDASEPTTDKKRIYILHHFPGHPVVFDGDSYAAYDGIPRVVRVIVNALSSVDGLEIVVTAYSDQVESVGAYFRQGAHANNLRVLCVDAEDLPNVKRRRMGPSTGRAGARSLRRAVKWIRKVPKRLSRLLVAKSVRRAIRRSIQQVKHRHSRIAHQLRRGSNPASAFGAASSIPEYIGQINDDPSTAAVLVPHYYWFPESVKLRQRTVLYLPDYVPHFFHETGEFKDDEGLHTDIGRMIAHMADAVLCNSEFTRAYLPISRIQVPVEKIRVVNLPLLNEADELAGEGDAAALVGIPRPYLFYPTQARPNKNLSLLIRVFDKLVDDGLDINLCLTSRLDPDAKSLAAFRRMRHRDRVTFREKVTDAQLRALYRGSVALCFTSMAEGNFPPQIHEALVYGVPVVASRLRFITERIPENMPDALILCESNDEEEFVRGCKFVLENREQVLARQDALLRHFENEKLQSEFCREIISLFQVDEGGQCGVKQG